MGIREATIAAAWRAAAEELRVEAGVIRRCAGAVAEIAAEMERRAHRYQALAETMEGAEEEPK